MVHYLYVGINRLKNLTDHEITLYDNAGEFATLPPVEEFSQGDYLIMENPTGRNALEIRNRGIGRGGVEVVTLFLSGEDCRVIPVGE